MKHLFLIFLLFICGSAHSQIITTIAGDGILGHSGDGSPATAAELSAIGVALDGAGDIYIADIAANNVRKVTMPLPVTTGVAPPGLPRGEEMLYIRPNPNEGSFTIRISSATDEQVQVIITNLLGQKVKEITATTNKDIALQTGCPPGMYFITAATTAGRQCGKVVVR